MRAKKALIKYGGNAMLNEELKSKIANKIKILTENQVQVILVHGGGPFINKSLDAANIQSQFVEGHRITTKEALLIIERTLKGEVNSDLVNKFNKAGLNAVGLSGKDGSTVIAKKRRQQDSKGNEIDLAQVGDVEKINTQLAKLLLSNKFTPIYTCIASNTAGEDFNINADMFAGHLAGALAVDYYIVLTDVDGLMKDIKQADSLISKIKLSEINALKGSIIKGGMIPKIESCEIAVQTGAKSAVILNGTKAECLEHYLLKNEELGTTITH